MLVWCFRAYSLIGISFAICSVFIAFFFVCSCLFWALQFLQHCNYRYCFFLRLVCLFICLFVCLLIVFVFPYFFCLIAFLFVRLPVVHLLVYLFACCLFFVYLFDCVLVCFFDLFTSFVSPFGWLLVWLHIWLPACLFRPPTSCIPLSPFTFLHSCRV